MSTVQLKELPRRRADKPDQPESANTPAKKVKDRWDKADIVLKPVGGLLTALAIAGLGFLGSSYLDKKQETETNLRLYTELMNKREEAENKLRTDMFDKILTTFLKPNTANSPGAALDQIQTEIFNLQLITRNFHESLDTKPLFMHALLGIVRAQRAVARDGGEEQNAFLRRLNWQKDRLLDIAGRVVNKQLDVLREAGQETSLTIPLDKVCTNKNIRTLSSDDYCEIPGALKTARLTFEDPTSNGSNGNTFTREFTLYVDRAFPRWRMAHVKVTAIERNKGGKGIPDVDEKTFWVGSFDFPTVDNTYLSRDERYTVVLDDIDDENVTIRLVYFPASFAGLREKSYYHQKVVQQLIQRSDLFGK